ncbi:glycosyltransferase [Streptacidiphilus jiangxiensis]|uniref:Glycosyltransferase involved in cell wall bisynthesis n=1 Tax=Streptacidiphilus jiangxiensis TaxID=235985 RepID=A0A1H7QPZ1_STRJI|nr:glycosyltransferase [Streptacidiphilus jiangxiensis]SEL49685.1 Glycosyltransferase involved in cell wall bisynthesis [Streptacidiphilus jiangxiensis]
MRVATVITRMQAGAGVVALRGALALDPQRYQVTFVAGSGDRLLDEARAAGLEVLLEPALRSPIAPHQDLLALHRLTRLFVRRGFDVVHTHSSKAGALGRVAAHRAGVPRIVHTFHGFPFHEFQSAPRREAYVRIERRVGRFTDVALCVGTAVSVEAVRRGLVGPERVRTIAIPVPVGATTVTPQTRAHARRALGLTGAGPVVGAVGRLSYQKAPEDFVAALLALHRPDVTGVWIGGGELAHRMQELARDAMPRARIVLAGERGDVPELLPAFDVFALPSRYEGLPVAICEAMVCGVPVVATAVNSVPDVVCPGESGLLVPPERPDLFARAVAHLLDRPADAARMAKAARARIDDRFSEHALGETLAAAYSDGAPWTTPHDAPSRPVGRHAVFQ